MSSETEKPDTTEPSEEGHIPLSGTLVDVQDQQSANLPAATRRVLEMAARARVRDRQKGLR